MSKSKLNSKQKTDIAYFYASGNHTTKEIAVMYKCSESCISDALHYAVKKRLVPIKVALKIQKKSQDNVNKKLLVEKGLPYTSTKTTEAFRKDLNLYNSEVLKEHQYDEAYVEILKSRILILQNNIKTFDDTYSDADESQISKAGLESEYNFLTQVLENIEDRNNSKNNENR